MEVFQRQLLWRECSHHLLHHFPTTPQEPLHARYQEFPWREELVHLKAWQRGQTGIALVDAGLVPGNDYPLPVVNPECSRKQALERYGDWKRWSG